MGDRFSSGWTYQHVGLYIIQAKLRYNIFHSPKYIYIYIYMRWVRFSKKIYIYIYMRWVQVTPSVTS